MIWRPKWFDAAKTVADQNGWLIAEGADGRLLFLFRGRAAAINSTGNDDDAPRAIAAAAAAMRTGAPAAPDPIAGIDAAIKQGTDRISSAIPIAKAIIDGRKAMGLADKMAMLAERMQSVPKALEAKADALLPRLDALEAKGVPTFNGLAAVVADAEKGIAAAEAAMRSLTNGGPLLDSGDSSSGT